MKPLVDDVRFRLKAVSLSDTPDCSMRIPQVMAHAVLYITKADSNIKDIPMIASCVE